MSESSPSLPLSWNFVSRSESDTAALGAAVGQSLRAGAAVALIGNLGAGKTRLVRAIARAAGVDEKLVTSPTFVLVQEYDGRLPLYHFDTYRLGSVDEFLDLGAEEYFESGGVCLIEWADRVTDVLPDDLLQIQIEITGETSRTFAFSATGPVTQAVLADVIEWLSKTA